MTVTPNRNRYLSSISEELLARCNRIRDLIGRKHWLTDGHHKESLLLGVLRRHLPVGLIATRGFVISPVNDNFCSTEQDILVVDALTEAPVFYEDGVVIALPKHVLGAISVKTTLTKETLHDSLAGLQSLNEVPDGNLGLTKRWNGIFFYTPSPEVEAKPQRLYDYLEQSPASTDWDQICCLPKLLLSQRRPDEKKVVGYDCGDLAAAYFLGDLLDHIASVRSPGGTSSLRTILDDYTPERF